MVDTYGLDKVFVLEERYYNKSVYVVDGHGNVYIPKLPALINPYSNNQKIHFRPVDDLGLVKKIFEEGIVLSRGNNEKTRPNTKK